MSVTIRKLTREILCEYLGQLIAISEICWREINADPWLQDNFLQEHPGKWLLSSIAFNGNEPVGFLISTFRWPPKGGTRRDKGLVGYINKLVIRPEHRRNGIASQLVNHTIEMLSNKMNAREVRLSIDPHNTNAILFWKKQGFTFMETIRDRHGDEMHLYQKELS